MKKIHVLLTMLMLMAFSVGNVWADYSLVYTLDGTITSGGDNGYASDGGGLTQDGIDWSVTGNTTINPWRIGGKNLTNQDRAVYSKTAIEANVAKIEIEHGTKTLSAINSMKVEVASDNSFSTIVSTFTPTFVASQTVTLTRPSDKDWSDCYYRITYNVNAGGSNQYLQLKSVKFYTEAGASTDPSVSVTPTAINFGKVLAYSESDDYPGYTAIKELTVKGSNLTSNVYLEVTNGLQFKIYDPRYASAYMAYITLYPKEGAIDTTLAISLSTGTSTSASLAGTLNVKSLAETPEFTAFDVDLSAELVALPSEIEGSVVDQLVISDFGVTGSYTSFSDKQASNSGHSSAIYGGMVARGGNETQYNIQLNNGQTSGKLRELVSTASGGSLKRVIAWWATQTNNVNNRKLTVYGSNTAFAGDETEIPSTATKIGDITYTTGDFYGLLDVTDDYKFVLIVADNGAMYMDRIDVVWGPKEISDPAILGKTPFYPSTTVTMTIATDGADIIYTMNGDDPLGGDNTYSQPIVLTETKTIKARGFKGVKLGDVVSKTFTKATPISVTDAIAVIPNENDTKDDAFVYGYVCTLSTADPSNGQMTYYISKDGTETNRLQIYKGKGLNNADFSAISDIALGDKVVVYGQLKNYGGTYEMNSGNYIVECTAKGAVSSLDLTGTNTKTEFEYGDHFDPATDGSYTVKAIYENGYREDVTSLVTWAIDGKTLEQKEIQGAGTCALTATYSGKSDWVYINVSKINEHKVTFSDPDNGTLVVKWLGSAIDSGDEFVKTYEFTVVATPADGYQLATLTANDVDIKDTKAFTMGTEDIEVVATFSKIPEGVLKLYNKGVVDFGTVEIGSTSVGTGVLFIDATKLTPNSDVEVSINGTDGYFEIQVPATGKITANASGVINYYAVNIVPTEAALASVGEKVSTLRFHSADLAEDSLATIKMTVANKYAITVPDITGGTLGWSPAKPDKAFAGAEFTLTATPSTGYEGGTIKILKASNDSEVTDDVLSGSTLTMPAFAIKVVVTFTEIVKTDAPISWYSNTKVTKKYGASEWLNPFTWRTLTNEENLEVTVTSSNTDVIETMQKDEYNHWYPAAVKAAGTTTITATFAGNDTYNETSVSYELEILKGNAPLSWNKENGSGTIRKKTGNDFATLNNTQNLPVTFSSSNAAIASVDASTGAISMHKGGEVLISANLADHACYRDTAVSYNLTVNKLQLTLQFGRGSEDFDESEYTINLNNTSDTWGPGNRVNSTIYGDLQELAELRSSDESIATINTTYNVPIATGKGGSTVISLGYATNDSIIGDTISYTLIVVAKEKAAAGLAWSAESANVRFGSSSNVYPTLTNPNTLAVTYESTDESIATIAANGSITLKANGSTTIKAIFAGDDDYLAATVTYTLNVSAGVVTTTPSPVAIDFGEVLLGDDGANYTATFTLHIENLTEGQYNQVKISSANCEILAPTNDFATDMNRDGVIDQVVTVHPSDYFLGLGSSSLGVNQKNISVACTGTRQFEDIIVGTVKMNVVQAYAITLAMANGSLTLNGAAAPKVAKENTEFTLAAVPAEGYELGVIKIFKTSNESEVTEEVLSGSTLTMPAYAITISATFTALPNGECGKQGDNLLWQYNPTTKVLTITGSGEMADYTHSYSDGSNTTPWDQYRNDITSVVLPNGITSIGNWAFGNFKALTAITLPNTITVLGESAFNYSTALVSINMPTQLQTLGKMAFFNTRITSLTIPASVTSIGQQIVGAVTTLTAISVEAANTVYDSRNNCNAIIRKSDNVLIVGCKNSTIPSDITGIADWAFDRGYAPATVELPAGVTSIGEHAFFYGRAITLLRIPVGVTSISSQAFSSAFDADGADVYVEWTTPLVVFDDIVVATNVANATLHVPYGTKSLYEVANGWKNFGTIVEADKPTGLDDAMVSGDSQVRKVIIDSKLFIIRGDKMFDAQGKLVK